MLQQYMIVKDWMFDSRLKKLWTWAFKILPFVQITENPTVVKIEELDHESLFFKLRPQFTVNCTIICKDLEKTSSRHLLNIRC